jgi:hypothetical protein
LKKGYSEILGDSPSIAMNAAVPKGAPPQWIGDYKIKIPPRRAPEKALKRTCTIFQ